MAAHDGSAVRRLRARTAVVLFAIYAALTLSFWTAGALAYWHGSEGAARFLGVLYVPSLALPLVGRGRLAGIAVGSAVWWWWFAAQAVVAFAAICLYPYDRAPREPSARSVGRTRRPAPVP